MAQVTAGVDLGGTKIQAVVVVDGEVAGQARLSTPRTNAEDVLGEIVASVRAAVADAGVDDADLGAIGIGTPGSVDRATGHVSKAANVPGFGDDIALGPTLSVAFGGIAVR